MRRLERKTALVTGGASGLGKAIAHRLASEGSTVIITDVDASLGAETASQEGFLFLEQDVCDEARWAEVIREVEERCGSLHILVNNAGISGAIDAVSPENTTLINWKRIFSINVEGVFLGCRAAIPAMKRAGNGSIINISSVAGLLATPHNTAYGASKAAVRQLTKSVAQHCMAEGLRIRCNSVHPGVVITPLWERLAAETARLTDVSVSDVLARTKAQCPMNEFILPEDVAAVVAFLASDESRHITGTKVIVDGGIVGCDTFHLMKVTGREAPAR